MKKKEILEELQGIHSYMDSRNAIDGFGQISDLVEKLEKDTDQEVSLSFSEKTTLKNVLYIILDSDELKDKFWLYKKDIQSAFKQLDNRSFEDARNARIEFDDNK